MPTKETQVVKQAKKQTQTRNPAATQERILKAATAQFAQTGFDGARVDQIAEAASINKQMLYHYFGDKDELFTAVLERAYEDIRTHESALELDALPADEAILKLVEFTWNYYLENPEFIRLLNSENQLEARHLKSSVKTKPLNVRHLEITKKLLKRGQKEGCIRKDLSPIHLNINIAALGFFYLMNRHTLSIVFERDLGTRPMLTERLAVMKDMIARWIRP